MKPLSICLISIAAVLAVKAADDTRLHEIAPAISTEPIEALLSIMAASMLVIATFAVASMVAAYDSTSSTATPRSFGLVIADDVSQNALSTFVGAFIFSIVALTAVKNDFYEAAGRVVLFALTVGVFAVVVITFVRWVDRIARLGRLETTIDKVEKAATAALLRRGKNPALRCVPAKQPVPTEGRPVFASAIGYVQQIDVASLQAFAKKAGCRVVVAALPGTFVTPDRPLAYVLDQGAEMKGEPVTQAFMIGGERVFDDDPRFGFVV